MSGRIPYGFPDFSHEIIVGGMAFDNLMTGVVADASGHGEIRCFPRLSGMNSSQPNRRILAVGIFIYICVYGRIISPKPLNT